MSVRAEGSGSISIAGCSPPTAYGVETLKEFARSGMNAVKGMDAIDAVMPRTSSPSTSLRVCSTVFGGE